MGYFLAVQQQTQQEAVRPSAFIAAHSPTATAIEMSAKVAFDQAQSPKPVSEVALTRFRLE